MTVFTLKQPLISEFKQSWPCHGLHDDLDVLRVETDSRGDVVDIEAFEEQADGTEAPLEWREFDGPAMAALVQDCIALGDRFENVVAAAPAL